MAVLERFFSFVHQRQGCWEWQGEINHKGYPRFKHEGKLVTAHRFAYEALREPIAEGLELDHLCRNRACVNPSHLEPVTHRENVRRGNGFGGRNARKTRCEKGHLLSGSNLYTRPNGWRECRECTKEYKRKYRKRKKVSNG